MIGFGRFWSTAGCCTCSLSLAAITGHAQLGHDLLTAASVDQARDLLEVIAEVEIERLACGQRVRQLSTSRFGMAGWRCRVRTLRSGLGGQTTA